MSGEYGTKVVFILPSGKDWDYECFETHLSVDELMRRHQATSELYDWFNNYAWKVFFPIEEADYVFDVMDF